MPNLKCLVCATGRTQSEVIVTATGHHVSQTYYIPACTSCWDALLAMFESQATRIQLHLPDGQTAARIPRRQLR